MRFHKALPRPISKRSNNKGGPCCIVERPRTDEAVSMLQYSGATVSASSAIVGFQFWQLYWQL